MSLDVRLEDENGRELYWFNITHNLNKMARKAGLYQCLWRPEEIGITTARAHLEGNCILGRSPLLVRAG
jgi:hypothetical protein